MKNKKEIIMFKKTLIALTVLGMSSTALSLTIHPSTQPASNPVLVLAPAITHVATLDTYANTAFFVHLDANYASGNTVQLTYSGAAVDEDYVFPTAAIPLTVDTAASASTCAASQIASFAGWDAATLTATYQFTGITAATDGCVMAIPVISVDGASLASTDVFKVTGKGATAYGTLELLAETKLIDVAVNNIVQTLSSPILNQVVDVENGRFVFTSGNDDVVTITTTEGANSAGAADLLGAVHTITGNFAWTNKTVAGVASRVGVAVTNSTALAITDTTVSWQSAAGTIVNAVTLTPQTGEYKTILPSTTYNLSTAYTYDNGTDTAVIAGALTGVAGAWTLNGASITAFGIPNSASVTPFLWVQNKGISVGDITVDVRCDGATISAISAGTAAASANTSIGAAVQAGVDAAGTCGATSRYDAVVTVNGPAGDMELNAGYRVTAADGSNDRLTLETSDSLN